MKCDIKTRVQLMKTVKILYFLARKMENPVRKAPIREDEIP